MKVYKAINAIQSALSKTGILKDRKNSQQGYNFRGIDDVYNALSPLLSEHGLVILPRAISRTATEKQSKAGGLLNFVVVEVEFDFISSEDGSRHTVKMYGEAMDSADKATNKALSAAYKYACLEAFAIPTEADNDADATTHEIALMAAPKSEAKSPVSKPTGNVISEAQGRRLYAIWKNKNRQDDEVKEYIKIKYGFNSTKEITKDTYEEIVKWVESNEPASQPDHEPEIEQVPF